MGLKGVPSIQEYLKQELKKDDVVGIDGRLFTISNANELKKELGERGILLKHFESNFVDQIWQDQPSEPTAPIMVLDEKYAGQSLQTKLEDLRKDIEKNGCLSTVVTALDEICWLFNLRGNDIDFNPVFKAFALVSMNDCTLYIDSKKANSILILGNGSCQKPFERSQNCRL